MAQTPNIDGLLIQWGDRLFYPGNRIVKVRPDPKLTGNNTRDRANAIRARIAAALAPRIPQVMVKVTGGGRGMRAIAAHFRYISKNGRLDIEDERGELMRGKDMLPAIADDWRFGGSLIDDLAELGQRREAFNIMLSMPRGVDPLAVLRAAREFAQTELADHKYVMVLHDHQANPHVHLSVRAESKHGKRLNPRKADLQRWRETFAEKLRGWGVEAEATRRAGRALGRNDESLWRIKARGSGRLRNDQPDPRVSRQIDTTAPATVEAWKHIAEALMISSDSADRTLAPRVAAHLLEMVSPGQGRILKLARPDASEISWQLSVRDGSHHR
ncbi:MAG: conjugal transfer protein TraS [Paucibacter sp.]|nr:conjugal transfer protein TraS [Roseateles sp.]